MDSDAARTRFEAENTIATIDPSLDGIYLYDEEHHRSETSKRPWKDDVHHFKNVKISAVALLKMVIHARSGGRLEVMGILQGKISGDTMIVMDSFALPVEGTETRVNASAGAFEYIVNYLELIKATGRLENALGWYHSHPGYGCWLSGIDVATQKLHQQFQEPWLAVVVDPVRTISAGKVELGAFRTYPDDYKPPDEGPSDWQAIPIDKIEDFGVHCKSYYPLSVSYFKSSLDTGLLDLLWNKYWVNTLASSPLSANLDYFSAGISDLAQKMEQAEAKLSHGGRMGGAFAPSQDKKKESSPLDTLAKDSTKLTVEQVHGLMTQVLKDSLFNV